MQVHAERLKRHVTTVDWEGDLLKERIRKGSRGRALQNTSKLVRFFWSRVHVTETCWLWVGAIHNKGYGGINLRKHIKIAAHVFSFVIHYGTKPKGLHVLHRCDVPNCVRPDHLFTGTSVDNVKDMVAKGRNMRGDKHYAAKLSVKKVLEILRKHEAGISGKDLAIQYGVSSTTISAAISGRTWKCVSR